MKNPFDQFDNPPQPVLKSVNPFDQFDTQGVSGGTNQQILSGNSLRGMGNSSLDVLDNGSNGYHPSPLVDVAGSIAGSGAPKGVADALGAVPDAMNLVSKVPNYLEDKARSWTNTDLSPEEKQLRNQRQATYLPNEIGNLLSSSNIKSAINPALYQPQTSEGQHAANLAEGATSGALLGGPTNVGANAIIGGASAGGADVGNTMFQGNKYQPYISGGMSLAAGLGAALGHGIVNPAIFGDTGKALANVTEEQYAQAQALQQQAARQGTPITSAEAIARSQGGNAPLMNIQAKVEGAAPPQSAIGQMLQQRPASNDAAINGVTQSIAPGISDPNTMVKLPYNVQKTASGVMDDVTKQRSTQTSPLYNAATAQQITPGAFDDNLASINSKLAEIGTTSEAGGKLQDIQKQIIANSPQTQSIPTGILDSNGKPIMRTVSTTATIGPINQIFKETRNTLEKSANIPGAVGSAVKGVVTPENTALGAALSGMSEPLQQANALHANLSDTLVNPVSYGPVGKLANSSTDIQNPVAGQWSDFVKNDNANPAKIAEATSQMYAKDPQTTANLLGAGLQTEWNKANPVIQGGGRDINAGAKYATAIDTPKIAAMVQSVSPQFQQQYGGLIDALHAQGQRISPVATGTAPPLHYTNPLTYGPVLAHKVTNNRGVNALSDALADPNNGVQKLRALAGKTPSVNPYALAAGLALRNSQ